MLPFNLGAGGASDVYTGDIGHSLRFRGRSASAYASKTFGTPTSQNSWAFSCWVKFSEMPNSSNYQPLLSAGPVGTSTWPGETLHIYQDGTIAYYAASSAGTHNVAKRSARVFRDPTSWVHIFVRKTAAANSGLTFVRLWVNNEEVTSWVANTYTGTQASVPDYINVASTSHVLGRNFSEYLQGYMSRVCFVDNGGSLLPTDFIQFNTEINEWVSKSQSAVKAVVDAGGTNSFMLDFDDATSLTTLGYDKSSKGNNWTLNNFSLTAGTTYDHMLDVPGNSFATLNPLGAVLNRTLLSLSEGNLKAAGTSVLDRYAESTLRFGTAKCVAEATLTAITSGNPSFGVMNDDGSNGAVYFSGGEIYVNGGFTTPGASYTVNDTIRCEVDPVAKTVELFKNNTSIRQLNLTGTPTVFSTYAGGVSTWVVNFGQAPLHASATYHSAAGGYFRDAPTAGYKALCQRNMPDPAILNPEKHFDVRTRTGVTGNNSVSGLSFAPDLIWSKCRNNAVDNHIQSRLLTWTGSTEWAGFLQTNSTSAEQNTGGGDFQNITSSGYSIIGDNTRSDANGYTYVDWLWKAGGAAVTNNAGSISSQVSANVTAGFSIVKHINTGAPGTIGHGLGKAPGLIINKVYDRTENWRVYFGVANKYLIMNNTAAEATDANIWNNTQPTSSVFSIGTYFSNGDDIISYCFAEIPGFSKIFSYTGNGNADGPFVHCGFKPKYVLIKRVDAAATWCVIDGVRNPSNVENLRLYPSAAAAEETNTYLDATSNGFKVRVDSAEPTMNASGGTYIGIAFADVPAKYSLAR